MKVFPNVPQVLISKMSKIFPLGGQPQLKVEKALETNYHSTAAAKCPLTWHLIAEPEQHCNQFLMIVHCIPNVRVVICIQFDFHEFLVTFDFCPMPNHKLAEQQLQIYWELELIKFLLFRYSKFLRKETDIFTRFQLQFTERTQRRL